MDRVAALAERNGQGPNRLKLAPRLEVAVRAGTRGGSPARDPTRPRRPRARDRANRESRRAPGPVQTDPEPAAAAGACYDACAPPAWPGLRGDRAPFHPA